MPVSVQPGVSMSKFKVGRGPCIARREIHVFMISYSKVSEGLFRGLMKNIISFIS